MKRLMIMAALIAVLVASSCNVTRVVTTESMCIEHGDTAAVITTRTIEVYDATKKSGADNSINL